MAYFSTLPTIYYDFNIAGERKVTILRDLSFNTRFQKQYLNDITLYDEYDIQDGETPEIVSEKVYGSPDFHWIIMLMNERFDYINDWPLSSFQLTNYITDKYGYANRNAVHHYNDYRGFQINSTEKYYDPYTPNHVVTCELQFGSNQIKSVAIGGFIPMEETSAGNAVLQVAGLGLPYGEFVTVSQLLTSNTLTLSHQATETLTTPLTFIHMIDPMLKSTAITNFQYEWELNEAKRRIKLLHPSMLPIVIKQLTDLAA